MSIFRLKMKSSGKRTCFGRLGIYVHLVPGDSLTLTEHALVIVNLFMLRRAGFSEFRPLLRSYVEHVIGLSVRSPSFVFTQSQNSEFKEKRNFIEQKQHSENQDPNEEHKANLANLPATI